MLSYPSDPQCNLIRMYSSLVPTPTYPETLCLVQYVSTSCFSPNPNWHPPGSLYPIGHGSEWLRPTLVGLIRMNHWFQPATPQWSVCTIQYSVFSLFPLHTAERRSPERISCIGSRQISQPSPCFRSVTNAQIAARVMLSNGDTSLGLLALMNTQCVLPANKGGESWPALRKGGCVAGCVCVRVCVCGRVCACVPGSVAPRQLFTSHTPTFPFWVRSILMPC